MLYHGYQFASANPDSVSFPQRSRSRDRPAIQYSSIAAIQIGEVELSIDGVHGGMVERNCGRITERDGASRTSTNSACLLEV